MVELPPPSPTIKSQDHIFISYSSKDRAFVDQLADQLRKRGHTVWIDFEGIRGGTQWKQSISDALHPSKVVLLVLSPDSIVSDWVEEEIRTARSLDKQVIPILLRPVNDIDKPNLAYIYKEIHYRDFTKGFQHPFEELLKDLPKPKHGIAGHCQKLIAKLASSPWGLEHYIESEAKLLPIHASPYEDGVIRGQGESLMKRLWHSHRVVVLGEPGVGKSVAIERLAWELASNDPPILPIIIKLLEYDGKPLLEWIRRKLREHDEIKLNSLEETHAFLDDSDHNCYFLFDGLNEIRPQNRDNFVDEFTGLASDYPSHRMVVTSRVQDEAWRRLRQGSAVEETFLVQTIKPEQIHTYLTAHLGEADAQKLWSGLDERIKGLASTPLLLWLIKEAWLQAKQTQGNSHHIKMPDNRGNLYRSFVNRLLQRDRDRNIAHAIPERTRLNALKELALHLHDKQALNIHRDTVEDKIGYDVLDALLKNGFLTGDIEIRFAPHQTMQEHFAASALLDEMRQKNDIPLFEPETHVLSLAHDPWWDETFIHIAGLIEDPNSLAQSIARHNPWLALWCVQEGKQVNQETRQIVEKRSSDLVSSTKVMDRRNAAHALAEVGTNRTIDYLAQLSVDADEETATISFSTLQKFGRNGQKALFLKLPTTNLHPQVHATYWRWVAEVDLRAGVALLEDGLPDIQWGRPVPRGRYIVGDNQVTYDSLTTRLITIDYRYCLAKYLVTNAQFEAFVQAMDGINSDKWWDGFERQGRPSSVQSSKLGNQPRERVTWYQAVAFCRWLTYHYRQKGLLENDMEIRLPTQYEWEVAARYPDGRKYAWGNEFKEDLANTREGGIGCTTAVGIYIAGKNEALDLYDLNGNIFEWTLTEWVSNKDSYKPGVERILCGGSWNFQFGRAQSDARFRHFPFTRIINNGFRVVCAPPIPE